MKMYNDVLFQEILRNEEKQLRKEQEQKDQFNLTR